MSGSALHALRRKLEHHVSIAWSPSSANNGNWAAQCFPECTLELDIVDIAHMILVFSIRSCTFMTCS